MNLQRTTPQKGGWEHSNGYANCQHYGVLASFQMNQDWIVVYTAQGELEETHVSTFLNAHGVPTSTRGEALRKTHGLTLDGLGQVEILVAPENAAEARALLEAAERGDLALSEDDGHGLDPG